MAAIDDEPTLTFATQADWERWLEENHSSSGGVWIKVAKKASGIESVTTPEALEIALCFGWIDAVRRSLDETYFLQRYTPRAKRSRWSRINRDTALRLIDEGRMRPSGLAEVERAKADGRWDAAYPSAKNMTVPDDLKAELEARPTAKDFFDALDSRNRYAILYRLHDAKRLETRARRLEQFVKMLEAGERPYP